MSSCQIITNNRGEILGVNAPNGQPSILFEEGYKYLSGEDYVNIKKHSSLFREKVLE